MKNIIRIAIDGPGGAGKSTIAKLVAKKLNIDYVDTGAMYRAIGLKLKNLNIDPKDVKKIEEVLLDTRIDFLDGSIFLDEKNVDKEIRTPEISMAASDFSAVPIVRKILVDLQREMGKTKSLVMDGRDIGTNVLPDAEVKVFLTASAEERAKRRYVELLEKDQEVSYDKVLSDIIKRDEQDTNRLIDPLKPAEDAIILDTTNMTIYNVIDFVLKEAENGNC